MCIRDRIYVGNLCQHIIRKIQSTGHSLIPVIERDEVPYDFEKKVTEILDLLVDYKELYFDQGFIPVSYTHLFLPLISYPYLIRVLGLELNGMIVFAYSIVSYLNLFISFGFNSSTTRNIASLESDKCISNIVFSTYLCKLILFSFSVCLFRCV